MRDDEVLAVVEERLHGRGRTGGEALRELAHAATGEVGVLLGARERELLLDDRLREHEPRVVAADASQVLECAERVEAGVERRRQPLTRLVQPEAGGTGEDADAVVRPHGVPVADALGVVPHAVVVDDIRPGGPGEFDAAPVDVLRHAPDDIGGGLP